VYTGTVTRIVDYRQAAKAAITEYEISCTNGTSFIPFLQINQEKRSEHSIICCFPFS
jgi:hypothetical protein